MSPARLLLALGVAAAAAGTATGVAVLSSSASPDPEAFFHAAGPASSPLAGLAVQQELDLPYDANYHFIRVSYSGGGRNGFGGFGRGRGRGGRGATWAHDYPRADVHFLAILMETTFIRTSRSASNVLGFDDPDLMRFPISYVVEPGYWQPSDEEVEALGAYLLKGGFLIVDDFRGPYELDNLLFHLKRALPDLEVQEVPQDHDIFDSFFRLAPDDVVPPYGGYPALWLGIYEDNDPTKRIMVMINANNDMAEYWEFSDVGYYAIDLSNDAYKLGVNYVIYALTH